MFVIFQCCNCNLSVTHKVVYFLFKDKNLKPTIYSAPLFGCVVISLMHVGDGRTCTCRPGQPAGHKPTWGSKSRAAHSEWEGGVLWPCACLLCFMWLDKWDALAAVSQPVDRQAAPVDSKRLASAVGLHWRWVVLQKSVDSKAWTCLHCSQRYAYTDQLTVKVSVPSMFITQDAQFIFLNVIPPSVLSYTMSSQQCLQGILASHFKQKKKTLQCRSFFTCFCVCECWE